MPIYWNTVAKATSYTPAKRGEQWDAEGGIYGGTFFADGRKYAVVFKPVVNKLLPFSPFAVPRDGNESVEELLKAVNDPKSDSKFHDWTLANPAEISDSLRMMWSNDILEENADAGFWTNEATLNGRFIVSAAGDVWERDGNLHKAVAVLIRRVLVQEKPYNATVDASNFFSTVICDPKPRLSPSVPAGIGAMWVDEAGYYAGEFTGESGPSYDLVYNFPLAPAYQKIPVFKDEGGLHVCGVYDTYKRAFVAASESWDVPSKAEMDVVLAAAVRAGWGVYGLHEELRKVPFWIRSEEDQFTLQPYSPFLPSEGFTSTTAALILVRRVRADTMANREAAVEKVLEENREEFNALKEQALSRPEKKNQTDKEAQELLMQQAQNELFRERVSVLLGGGEDHELEIQAIRVIAAIPPEDRKILLKFFTS